MNGFYESFNNELNPDWNIHLMIAEPGFVKTDYLTRSVVMTERHPAYLDAKCATNQVLSMLEQARKGVESAGTPGKLAEIITGVVENGTKEVGIPLRLPLGLDSLHLIGNSLQKQLLEMDTIRPFAERFVGTQGMGAEVFEKLV
jgi:hypothetical protein